MKESFRGDREYLQNKYHRADEPFNAFRRMAYHGYEYDETTGLDEEEMEKNLRALSASLEGQPHPIHKAALFAYVLEHTRIDVNEHDYFIGIYSWGRPISRHTVFRWAEEVYEAFPEEMKVLQSYEEAGAVYGGLDFDHTVPDWDALMELGFPGLLERAQSGYRKLQEMGGLTVEQEAFFRGMEREYKAIICFVDRLYQYALTKDFTKAPVIAECLLHLRDGAPTTTYEALQMIYLYFMLSESIEHYQVRSLGYGLDSTLYPFFVKDLEEGRCTREEIAEFLRYFLMQWSAIGNYWGQPFYLGGTGADGRTKVNELSFLILDVYEELGIYNPKIQIKINQNTPKAFVCKALTMIRRGSTSIVFCNEEVIRKALMARGYTYEEALEGAVISGCYEYGVKRKEVGIADGFLNALKPVSLVLDNGLDVMTGKQIGLKTGTLEELISFEKFYKAYLQQLEHLVRTYFLDALDALAGKVGQVNPSLMFSGTIGACVETMTDALDCGIENVTSVTFSAIGSAVDALMAVRELVYEKRAVTLGELNEALHHNWEGYEGLRHMALQTEHKYGNQDAMADQYAAAITRFLSGIIRGHKNSHGGRYVLEMHSARAFVIQGEKTMATPDGRRAGQETSKNASPTPGADKKGITALINSAVQMDTVLCDCGFCVDAMLHPSAVEGEDGLEALYALLITYRNKGGASIHFNIFDPEILKDARRHPEKYQHLQVRVCGWNVLWNDMSEAEQDAYILRAESIR